MAYSSWTSDLKTRSSVGFLGKVVNLLVQAKDRVDTNHTTLVAQNNVTVAGALSLTSEMIDDGQITKDMVLLKTTGSSDAEHVLTIAAGTVHGQVKKLVYFQQNAAKKVKVNFESTGLVGHNSSLSGGGGPATVQYLVFSDQAEWCEIVWSTTFGNRWVLGPYSGATSVGTA